MEKRDSQTGGAHIVIVVVLALALVGGLGYVFWNNFLNKKEAAVAQSEAMPTPKAFCSDGENIAAEKGVFCSEEIGIKFTVPVILTNKVTKSREYPVYKGPLDYNAKQDAGMSEIVYAASVTGNDNFVFTIAKESLRSGYLEVHHALQNVYFDERTGEFSLVNTPIRAYDSATDSFTQSGEYSMGEALPSFDVGGVKFYKGTDGDAGMIQNVYLAVINNKIVKIQLVHSGRLGGPDTNDPTTIDTDKVFAELEQSIKSLKVLKS